MRYIVVDVEADGPIPGEYSMISFGAVLVDDALDTTFYGELRPISEKWVPSALAISGYSREDTMKFDDPKTVMERFLAWVEGMDRGPCWFIADNAGFDWSFVNWYFHHFCGENPFGWNSDDLSSIYRGLVRDITTDFEHLRVTTHSHNALDDAMGNAEALVRMIAELGFSLPR